MRYFPVVAEDANEFAILPGLSHGLGEPRSVMAATRTTDTWIFNSLLAQEVDTPYFRFPLSNPGE